MSDLSYYVLECVMCGVTFNSQLPTGKCPSCDVKFEIVDWGGKKENMQNE